MRTLFWGIAFLAWSAFSGYWYVCQIRGLCPGQIIGSDNEASVMTDSLSSEEAGSQMAPVVPEGPMADPDPEGIRFSTLYVRFEQGTDSISNENEIRDDIYVVMGAVELEDSIKVALVGHTDSTGAETVNYQLGMQRATALKAFMVREGLAEWRIQVYSKGETEPIAPNETPEGRAQNRRVEVFIQ